MKDSSQYKGFIIKTNSIGKILEVRLDDFLNAAENVPFLQYIDPASMGKVMAFLTELNKTESILGWEINVKINENFRSVYIAGLKIKENFIIIGSTNQETMLKYYNDFIQMNNIQVNTITKVIFENKSADLNDSRSNDQFDELTKINNELANLQRDLAKKNNELKILNLAVKNSIDYAERIQFSILPSNNLIKKYFDDSFIYFKPKDTIGGDFYWFYQHENYKYIATVDATGHGVPGAMMSMILSSSLNEILALDSAINTDEILNQLHKKLHVALKQDAGDRYSQDGCDVCLCRFDFKNQRISFAGAQTDLYIFKGENIERLKGNKKSIGGESIFGIAEYDRKFDCVEIDLPKDALIILSTDGIFDQLNLKNKAFGNSAILSFFENNQQAKADILVELLDKEIKTWSKGVNQQDDMLVIGLKIKNEMKQ